jgi:hypothetical protein
MALHNTNPKPSPPCPRAAHQSCRNWGTGSTGDANATHSVAFTGLVDVKAAIAGYTENATWCCPALRGIKLLSVGGGNAAGEFDVSTIKAVVTDDALSQIKAAGYGGVMWDVEEVNGPATDVVPAFQQAFATLKQHDLVVAVTISHSAPYQTDTPDDGVALAKAFAADENIDFISPQLYDSGQEKTPDFAETDNCRAAGCTWDLYKDAHAAFAPSIVEVSHYDPTIDYFRDNHSIDVQGYFVWKQEKHAAAAAAGKAAGSDDATADAAVADLVRGVVDGSGGFAVKAAAAEASEQPTKQQSRLAGWLNARLSSAYPQ